MRKTTTELSDYLREFNSVCWYPSAGYDFREMLYLSPAWAERKNWDERVFPDCFVLTNACGDGINRMFLMDDEPIIFEDDWTKITASDVKELNRLSVPRNPELAYDAEKMMEPHLERDFYKHYGRVLAMTVHIKSDRLGEWDTELVYVIAENAAFAFDYLLENSLQIDYVYRAHYGYLLCADSAGNRSTGHFILRILHGLGTRYFITVKDWQSINTEDPAELLYEDALFGRGVAGLSEVVTIPADPHFIGNDYYYYEFGFYRVRPDEHFETAQYPFESTPFVYVNTFERGFMCRPRTKYCSSMGQCAKELLEYVCRLKNIRTIYDFVNVIPPDITPFPLYACGKLKIGGEMLVEDHSPLSIRLQDGTKVYLRSQWEYWYFLKLLGILQEMGAVAVPDTNTKN